MISAAYAALAQSKVMAMTAATMAVIVTVVAVAVVAVMAAVLVALPSDRGMATTKVVATAASAFAALVGLSSSGTAAVNPSSDFVWEGERTRGF